MPSRAASVHSRIRTGSSLGSVLKARLTASRLSLPVAPEKTRMRSSDQSVLSIVSSSRRSNHRRVSSYSVKMISRRLFQALPESILPLIHSASQRTLASGRLAWASAIDNISSTAASSSPSAPFVAPTAPALDAASVADCSS